MQTVATVLSEMKSQNVLFFANLRESAKKIIQGGLDEISRGENSGFSANEYHRATKLLESLSDEDLGILCHYCVSLGNPLGDFFAGDILAMLIASDDYEKNAFPLNFSEVEA